MLFREFVKRVRNVKITHVSCGQFETTLPFEIKGTINFLLTNATLNYNAEMECLVRDSISVFDIVTFPIRNKRAKSETFHVCLP